MRTAHNLFLCALLGSGLTLAGCGGSSEDSFPAEQQGTADAAVHTDGEVQEASPDVVNADANEADAGADAAEDDVVVTEDASTEPDAEADAEPEPDAESDAEPEPDAEADAEPDAPIDAGPCTYEKPNAIKITNMVFGNGHPGGGLDVDGDPTTCAPGSCSGGVDNSMSSVGTFVNSMMESQFAAGSVLLLFELHNPKFDNTDFGLAMHGAQLEPSTSTCDVQAELCDYLVAADNADLTTCAPKQGLWNVRSDGTTLQGGGGANDSMQLLTPIVQGVSVALTVHRAQIVANITVQDEKVETLEGIMAGAIIKDDMIAALDAIPEDYFPSSGKPFIMGILQNMLQPDIDLDGDGTNDAVSAGMEVSGIRASILGVAD